MVLSVVYYFLLPIGAAYYQGLFKIRVWGVVNVGLLFALSEFVVAWVIALFYSRRAGREFDQLAAQTRAFSTYVFPNEDLEIKLSNFFTKMTEPALTERFPTLTPLGVACTML